MVGGADYSTHPGGRQDERGQRQTFFLPSNSVSSACMRFYGRGRARRGWYCAHFGDGVGGGGVDLLVCKAVSVDIASMEERFLRSLRYTLINLLKPARPVSSSPTQEKSQAALNPSGIFFLDASGKSSPSLATTDSFPAGGGGCTKRRQTHTSSFPSMDAVFVCFFYCGGEEREQLSQWVTKPPETIMFVGSYRLPASSVCWITGTSVASR